MQFLGLTPIEWMLPILIGVTAGFCTNAIAIWMLFHPYRPIYLGPLRLLPVGAIPKEIDRIARRIGETVGKELLTPDDIARTLSSPQFRDKFDETLRAALQALLDRELGSLREMMPLERRTGLHEFLDRLLERIVEGVEIYLASPEWEARVRGFSQKLTSDFRERPIGTVLTPQLHDDLVAATRELWIGVRESPEFHRVIGDALERAIGNLLVSEKPLRHYVPAGAVNFGETFVAQYLPLLLERLGQVLEDPTTRERLQQALRRFVDRFLEERKTWMRVVGRLVITERTLSQTVDALEQGGVDEIVLMLREPAVQARVAQAINDGIEDLLDRPVNTLLGDMTPERTRQITHTLTERVLYLFRHPTTEEILISRLDGFLSATEQKTVGDLIDLFGEARARDFGERTAEWIVETSRSERTAAMLHRFLYRQSSWMLSVRIGRAGQYLPADAVDRAEALLFDPLWSFIQSRVPAAVAGLPVAQMVENKLKGYPIAKVEELIWRVSRNELVLIIYLGGFLGALIGSLMLFTASWQAGLAATSFFLLLSFVFINVKAGSDEGPPTASTG
jgi:uncharacterized membrane protein YheB (UPF0754 family)